MKYEDQQLKQNIKELTLMLLYLNSWIEKEWDFEYRRSWKGHDFDVLNELAEAGLITDSHRSKSVGITETGGKKAKELMDKYLMK